MIRLLYYGCTPGNDVAVIQNDLNLITGHTQQGSSMAALEVDGIFGSKSQSRVMEFQRINFLTVDGVVGEQTREKLDQLFLSEPGLQIKRIKGGVAGGETGGKSYGKMPAGETVTTTKDGFGKIASGLGGSKAGGAGSSGGGKTMGGFGFKRT